MVRPPEDEIFRRRRKEAMNGAKRASARAAAIVHGEMKRGLGSLATITSTAPWVGLLGTILGINNSFRGFDGSEKSLMAAIFEGLSQALVPTALGLIVALMAMWCYKYLLTEVEAIDLEMESVSLELINHLARQPQASPQ